jgi:membrane-associated phospholipid phosphatase
VLCGLLAVCGYSAAAHAEAGAVGETAVAAIAAVATPSPSGLAGGSRAVQPLLDSDYWKNYYRLPARLLLSPLSWTKRQWLWNLAIGGATAGLLFADDEVRDLFVDSQNGVSNDLAAGFKAFGERNYGVIAWTGTAAIGMVADPELEETSLLGLQAWIFAAVTQQVMKMTFHRERPDDDNDAFSFHGPSFKDSDLAFPSGHTMYAFSAASVLANRYPNDPYVAPIAYTIATLSGISRLYNDAHFMSDVFIGAAVGYGLGKLVVEADPFGIGRGYSLRPYATGREVGLNVGMPF